MDAIIPVVVNDLVSRLISRLIHTYQERKNIGQKLRRLHIMLISIHASIEEAKQRFITSRLILLQLNMFIEAVSQGYYLLETFASQASEEGYGQDEVSNVYSFSSFNPCKRIRRISNSVKKLLLGDKEMRELQEVMGLLEAIVANLWGFNTLVASYPYRFRRPYDTNLYVENCMFGRHVEREEIINFLLQLDDDSTLGVLPIIGRHRSGKKTLMENVWNDTRVRNHFSMVSVLDGDDLEGEMLEAPLLSWREGAVITNHDLHLKRCLFVIEFAFFVDEISWNSFYHRASNILKGTSSKIVIISSLKEAARLGTTGPISLRPLPPEQFWYFFRAIAFGSADPKGHPRLLSLAMQAAARLDAGFVRAQMCGYVLRTNPEVGAWSLILRNLKKLQKGHAYYRRHRRYISIHTIGRTEAAHSCIFSRSRMDVLNAKLPELTLYDMMTPKLAEIPPGQKFEVVLWRSILPPYRTFVGTYMNMDASAEKKQLFASNETLDDMADKILRAY